MVFEMEIKYVMMMMKRGCHALIIYSAAALLAMQTAEHCNTYSNSVCPSVCLSVCHTLVPYPDE